MFSWSQLPKPIIALSPMADITDEPFCTIVRTVSRLYQPVIFREMVSSEAIVRSNDRTLSMAAFDPLERPIIQQIFGSNPETMARAAAIIQDRFHPDGIDINMGCPVYKLTSNFNGAALMKEPSLAQAIVHTVKNAVSVSVSVKLRLGWSDPKEVLEIAPYLEEAGADLMTIHGRTKCQAYSGRADWAMIGRARSRVAIPVLANGDIVDGSTARHALSESGCAGVMIARGALGNPWIFDQIHHDLTIGDPLPPPSLEERFRVLLEHARRMLDRYGPKGIVLFRKHIPWYLKGLPNVKNTRMALVQSSMLEELERHLFLYLHSLSLSSPTSLPPLNSHDTI